MTLYDVFELGVIATVALGFLMGIAQVILSYLSQRNLNDMHSLGLQAIIGANEMKIVDKSLEDSKTTVIKQ